MTTISDFSSKGYGEKSSIVENIVQIRDTKPWFNNRTWVVNNKFMNIMIYGNIQIGSKDKFQRSKKIVGEDPNNGKNIH